MATYISTNNHQAYEIYKQESHSCQNISLYKHSVVMKFSYIMQILPPSQHQL